MNSKRHTGGNMEFYEKGNRHLGHTDSTQAFTNAYNEWQIKKAKRKKIMKRVLVGVIALLLILFLFNIDSVSKVLEKGMDKIAKNSEVFITPPTKDEGDLEEIEDGLTYTSEKTNEVEKLILKYTNEERAKKGVSALVWDDKLAEIAREHSNDMIENRFFEHDNLEGEGPTERAIRHGYPTTKELGGGVYSEGIAENIGMQSSGKYMGIGYDADSADSMARAQVESWMDSDGHRENILNPQYNRLGVGVAYDFGKYYSTQNFW